MFNSKLSREDNKRIGARAERFTDWYYYQLLPEISMLLASGEIDSAVSEELTFCFENRIIRVLVDKGQIELSGEDICRVLELENPAADAEEILMQMSG